MVLFTDPKSTGGLTDSAAENVRSQLLTDIQRANTGILQRSRERTPVNPNPLVSSSGSSSQQSYFKITYYAPDGKQRSFVFSLLPAIENHIPIQSVGARVPEVKTGIYITTRMRHRNIAIPGSTPVMQSIGPDSTTMTLTGLFIGNELYDTQNSINPIPFNDTAGQQSAFEISRIFNQEIVLPSIPVFIDIFASSGSNFSAIWGAVPERFTRLYVRGIITAFRSCTSRENRSYYALDIILTEYLQRNRVNPEIPEEVRAQEQLKGSCVVDFERYKKELTEYEQRKAALAQARDTTTRLDPPKPISEQCTALLKRENYPGAEALTIGNQPTPKPATQR
ncbi:hypothetical protein ACQ4M3_19115 [Leptolyngbya sp. AN03gr2]|uniref:hypothetical protein n=1 Tax=Leptolyngbya sp. AN03gr2 TaxID=3423364 RepID=UPI003D31F879